MTALIINMASTHTSNPIKIEISLKKEVRAGRKYFKEVMPVLSSEGLNMDFMPREVNIGEYCVRLERIGDQYYARVLDVDRAMILQKHETGHLDLMDSLEVLSEAIDVLFEVYRDNEKWFWSGDIGCTPKNINKQCKWSYYAPDIE